MHTYTHANILGAAPFESINVADIGDVPINPYNLLKTVNIIEQYYRSVVAANCLPLTLGGDHTLTYPILKAVADKHGPVGLVQVFSKVLYNIVCRAGGGIRFYVFINMYT